MSKKNIKLSGTMKSNLSIHKKLLLRSKSGHDITDLDNRRMIKITIVEAVLTRDTELFSKMDPYVIINN